MGGIKSRQPLHVRHSRLEKVTGLNHFVCLHTKSFHDNWQQHREIPAEHKVTVHSGLTEGGAAGLGEEKQSASIFLLTLEMCPVI